MVHPIRFIGTSNFNLQLSEVSGIGDKKRGMNSARASCHLIAFGDELAHSFLSLV